MAQMCVHKGCEKVFTDAEEPPCVYHPGPPVFHEGQKGWKCCKPRVLTFEEFMTIPPCTTGVHSTTDFPPAIEKTQQPQSSAATDALAAKLDALATSAAAATAADAGAPARTPVNQMAGDKPATPVAAPETDDDDPALEIPDGKQCRRRTCDASYKKGAGREDESKCVHHPGAPIFHEGSKGYSCCKRRVLEFDQFMRIEGCTTKDRHLFIGSGKKKGANATTESGEEVLTTVRHDFYQTSTTVIASFFLKKIDKDRSTVTFEPSQLLLDLVTSDATPKRYTTSVPLFGAVDPEKSTHKILGTKLEVTLAKADGASWPVLRSDQATGGEILQVGRAALV